MHAYGFNENALKHVYSYLCGRLQKVKAGCLCSSELDVLYGVPQGSILGPLLFNIDIYDILFIDTSSDIANYAGDNTPYERDQYFEELIDNLELTNCKIFDYFKYNSFRANANKLHF